MAKKKCPGCEQVFVDSAVFCPNDGKRLEDYEDEADSFIGMVLDGKYKIERLIGKGGMGNVYESKQLHMGLLVAVKILHPHLITDGTAVERFRREARSAHAVNHPNAISIMDFGVTTDNILYLVMELIDGISLHALIKKEGALDPVRAVRMMKQTCLAVNVAHQKAIIHRDLKPDNILITDSGTPKEKVKVIDFSIAKVRAADTSGNITTAGVVVGTPQYISPEQAQGFELDHRSDIYSMGIIMYQMLTGVLPFNGKTSAMLLMQHIQAKVKPLRELKPDIPEELDAAVIRALAKAPTDRPQTALIFAEEIEAAVVKAGLMRSTAITNTSSHVKHVGAAAGGNSAPLPNKDSNPLPTPSGSDRNAPALPTPIPTPIPTSTPVKKSFWQKILSFFSRG